MAIYICISRIFWALLREQIYNSSLTNLMEKEAAKPKIRIKIRAYDHKLIDQSAKQIVETAKRTGATISGPVPLPTEKTKYTVLKATFKFKDSREQFEMRVHKRMIDIFDATPKTVDSLTNLNLPAGVDVEIKMS